MEKPKKVKKIRVATDEELVAMLKREDYYRMLKYNHNPEDRLGIKWNVMRTKWSILNQYGRL